MPEASASPKVPQPAAPHPPNRPPQEGREGVEPPRHVAIIMDGNGRWAAERGLPRSEGHRRGVEALRRAVRAAGRIASLVAAGVMHPGDVTADVIARHLDAPDLPDPDRKSVV